MPAVSGRSLRLHAVVGHAQFDVSSRGEPFQGGARLRNDSSAGSRWYATPRDKPSVDGCSGAPGIHPNPIDPIYLDLLWESFVLLFLEESESPRLRMLVLNFPDECRIIASPRWFGQRRASSICAGLR
ncbi:hypothetical protein PUNSTDRAFT_118346 [Punctularia strigosozonata HHB-11173 SS5]|uniref:uncharacterized protein n=1 Tax=Punctularia strigosozonata (strain HHB-11173) TaxID=741275 RepID=UPI000441667C|nr:uncharacterized protein PUNSTDRAFT_118346 [Punctularia strigosozonata HHB-11173 SS5]EIN12556.1 hypothetical protein PUNSTDRAFT_118346 [Punctularia strigosozonata HHB-11173 SS5]